MVNSYHLNHENCLIEEIRAVLLIAVAVSKKSSLANITIHSTHRLARPKHLTSATHFDSKPPLSSGASVFEKAAGEGCLCWAGLP